MSSDRFLGARPEASGTRFAAHAPAAQRVEVQIRSDQRRILATLPLMAAGEGRFEAYAPGVQEGALYQFVLDGVEHPDPYARFLPWGVEGPAEVMAWKSASPPPQPLPLHQLSFYELHVGTFTAEGTYAAAAKRLPEIADLGVTAIELLPLSTFPGQRGWGYDGVAHFAPYPPYGRPDDLRALIAEARRLGLAVFIDVVLNHFGPVGNHLAAYDPAYFTREADNPWGEAPDYRQSPMRNYALALASYWFEEFGVDGLRLDATHTIYDPSPSHILAELHRLAAACVPPRRLIAEDERNEPALVEQFGLEALWADDFHHQVRVLLTAEADGYYQAFEPTLAALAKVISEGWIYHGQVYPPHGRPRGRPAGSLAPEHLLYCIQNHDQIGNRAFGTRLHHDAPLEAFCAMQALLLFLPSLPLLFMGQEWAASTPFLFFTDHHPELGARVSAGRRAEFAKFAAFADPLACAQIPDPQALETYRRSQLNWEERQLPAHRRVLELTTAWLQLRRTDPVLSAPANRADLMALARGDILEVERRRGEQRRKLLLNASGESLELSAAEGPRLWQSAPGNDLPAWGVVLLG